MNLTFGFISFFILIIIPGILFRRFYYFGEFSKQFDTKDPVIHSIFFSIVPGVILQIFGFWILNAFEYFETDNYSVFSVFTDFIYLKDKEVSQTTQEFLNQRLGNFVLYSSIIFFFSALSGRLLSGLIRLLRLDKNFKIFRFRNLWFYAFSGEILNLRKFKSSKEIHYNNLPKDHTVTLTYADILVVTPQGNRELYTGYVVDYDLNPEDISKIEKIYLDDAYRYKKPYYNDYDISNGFERICSNGTYILRESSYSPARRRIKIPGDLFVVTGKDILNINLTYIPSKKKEKKKRDKINKKRGILNIVLSFISLAILIIHFIYDWIGLDQTWLRNYFIYSDFWGKALVIALLNQFLIFVTPVKDKKGNFVFNKHKSASKFLLLIIYLVILYIFLIYEIVCAPIVFNILNILNLN